MPLYEYECKSCGNRFEKIQKFSDEMVRTCPTCGKDTVEQMISAPAVKFKGEGWYVTDYARKGSSQGSPGSSDKNASASGSSESSDSKAGSTSDTKAEKKSDSSKKD